MHTSRLNMQLLALLALPTAITALQALKGVTVAPLTGGAAVDVGALLDKKSAVVFGTYAADFNAIEYGQRLRHYAPKLKERGVESLHLILNADEAASTEFVELLGMDGVCEVYCDPSGAAGRAFGCGRGWLPDEDSLFDGQVPINAYGKLFGMLLGLGAWATLPAVIGGYLGNPFQGQPWIEDAMVQGSAKGRWPGSGLVVDTGRGTGYAFNDLPGVGQWPRRPLELATLRLQNMIGVSLQNWGELKPADDHLAVLTQLGGVAIGDGAGGLVYEWKDPGICAVCNFEDALAALDGPKDVPASVNN